MTRLNWKIIHDNVTEAREELEKIEADIASGTLPSEGGLQIQFEHAYHHLNFAWNARRMAAKRYKDMTDIDFNFFGRYPKDIKLPQLRLPRRTKRRAG